MLHLVFKPLTDTAILHRLAANDDVVFLDNGVFSLLAGAPWASALESCALRARLFVLQDQLACRGVSVEALVAGIKTIDYAGWVALTVKNKVIQSWM